MELRTVFPILFLSFSIGNADTLPIAGISIPHESGWRQYNELQSFADQPFERVWIRNSSKSIRMVSTTFDDAKKVCLNEKGSLEKKNFVTLDLFLSNFTFPNGCAFKAVRGKENFFIVVQDNPRRLPDGKTFESQNILIEQNGELTGFINKCVG